MTHANVYRYFRSKAALADAVMAEWLRPLEASLAQVADAPDPADDKLERLLLALAAARRDGMEADGNLFDLLAKGYDANQPAIRRHRQRIRALVERVVEEGVGADLFAVRRAERAVALVFDTMFRFLHPAAVLADRELARRTLDDRLATLVKLLLRGLKGGIA